MTRHWAAGSAMARTATGRAWRALMGPRRPRRAATARSPVRTCQEMVRSSSPGGGRRACPPGCPVCPGRPTSHPRPAASTRRRRRRGRRRRSAAAPRPGTRPGTRQPAPAMPFREGPPPPGPALGAQVPGGLKSLGPGPGGPEPGGLEPGPGGSGRAGSGAVSGGQSSVPRPGSGAGPVGRAGFPPGPRPGQEGLPRGGRPPAMPGGRR